MNTLDTLPTDNSGIVTWAAAIYEVFARDTLEENNIWVIGYDKSPEVLALGKLTQDRVDRAFLNLLLNLH